MPEQPNPPGFMEELAVVPEEEEVDSKLAEFLRDLGLEKYIQVRYGGKGREGEYIMLFQDDIQHENIAIVKNCAFIFQLVYILSPHLPED